VKTWTAQPSNSATAAVRDCTDTRWELTREFVGALHAEIDSHPEELRYEELVIFVQHGPGNSPGYHLNAVAVFANYEYVILELALLESDLLRMRTHMPHSEAAARTVVDLVRRIRPFQFNLDLHWDKALGEWWIFGSPAALQHYDADQAPWRTGAS
jgi:hypothetical protein